MDKKELNIIALSQSSSSPGNFVLVLEENKGFRRIPIIIGAFEAQAIAIALENMKTQRPLTHDLALTLLERGESSLKEIVISRYEDKIFSAQLVIKTADTLENLDARSSDAIALAVRKPCPIYTYEHILQEAGIVLESPGKSFGEKRNLQEYSLDELEMLLRRLLEKEDYESAKKIQDVIRRKKDSPS
ncbi:MAG: bifunctional nuclease family protein [Bacteroidota bacterium]